MQSELDQQVTELFHSNIDTTMRSLDELAPAISDCSVLMAQCLLSENKILCCGEGQSGALAQIFATSLLNRFEYERPSLPAITLNTDATTITAITRDETFSEIFSRQIRALGMVGDLLLVISNGPGCNTSLKAIQAAHDREMNVISISDQTNDDISALISPEDMEIIIPSSSRARIAEAQLLTVNCLSELIDTQLFGSA